MTTSEDEDITQSSEGSEELDEDATANQLIDAGFPEDEVEALFDPKKRRQKAKCGVRRVKKGNNPVLVYDPPPPAGTQRRRRGRGTRKFSSRSKKGILSKLMPYAMPGAAGITFYMAYTKRSKELFDAGTIQKDSVYDAIMYDVNNFDGTASWNRITDSKNIQSYGLPIAAGWGIKKFIGGTPAKLFGNILIGLGVGTLGKVVLDPPVENQRRGAAIRAAPAAVQVIRVSENETGSNVVTGNVTGIKNPF